MSFAPKHILAPLALGPEDSFEFAKETVQAACEMAKKLNAHLTLVHVTTIPIPLEGVDSEVTTKIYDTFSVVLESRIEHAQATLAKLKELAKSHGVKVKTEIVDADDGIANRICHYAKSAHVDLILINSHARHGLKRFLLGSIAERIVHISNVPVLILKRTKE